MTVYKAMNLIVEQLLNQLFFGGVEGFNAFFSNQILHDTIAPRIVITALKIFNQPVEANKSKVLKKILLQISNLSMSEQKNYLDNFIKDWSAQEKKSEIISELENQGVNFDELKNEIGEIGENIDYFDLILHIAFGKNKIFTRQERVNNIKKKNYFEKYTNQGVATIEDIKILTINPFNSIGSPIEIIEEFGGREAYFLAVRELEMEIYSQVSY